jgi:hypothetical protein
MEELEGIKSTTQECKWPRTTYYAFSRGESMILLHELLPLLFVLRDWGQVVPIHLRLNVSKGLADTRLVTIPIRKHQKQDATRL